MQKAGQKSTQILFVLIFLLLILAHQSYSQKINFSLSNTQNSNQYLQNLNREMSLAGQKILITDMSGKEGKEVQDTTIIVNDELKLYAGLYNNGRYRSEAVVDWFWTDSSHSSTSPQDSAVFLGTGTNIIFKPTHVDTGFIFVLGTAKAEDDSTGMITIIHGEKLNLSSITSEKTEITQGQKNVVINFTVENKGIMPSYIGEASLLFFGPDSLNVTNDYQINRTDTTSLIPIGQKRDFKFVVDVKPSADTILVSIHGKLVTNEGSYTNFEAKHQWQVQSPPQLNIDLIDPLIDEVYPGQVDVPIAMQISNKGGASVNSINAKLTFWYNNQNINDDYEFAMSPDNPRLIQGHKTVKIKLIVNVKPTATQGIILINGDISASDKNTGISYSDIGADIQASWYVTTLTSSKVGIISTKVVCPNVDETGNGSVNINQQYSVNVIVRNLGTQDVKNIGISLFSDGSSVFKSNKSQVIASLQSNQYDTAKYDFQAYAVDLPKLETFSASIDSANGGEDAINSAIDSLASVNIMSPANLVLQLETTSMQIAVGQIFNVPAEVINDHPQNADYDSTGTLSIRLPQGYELDSENMIQNFRENEKVIWKLRSPPVPQGPDTVLIYINQKPRDKNNPNEYAQVSVDSAILVVETLAAFIEITDVAIIKPAGARDDTVSTEQEFTVRAQIKSQQVENIDVKIIEQATFTVLDDNLVDLVEDSATWRLRAPQFANDISEKIIIQARGNIERDTTTKVYSQLDSSLSIFTVSRANLKVSAQIVSPPSAVEGQISPGLEFQIQGDIVNLGQAAVYGHKSLLIDVQDPTSFTVIGDTLLFVENNPVIWTIQASNNLDEFPKIIKIKLFDIPNDENSDTTAYANNENRVTDVQVFTGMAMIQLMIRKLPEIEPKAISPGITEIMMGIEFTNLTTDDGFPISVNALKFDIEDNQNDLIDPASLISGFRIRNNEFILGEAAFIVQNPIDVPLTYPINLDAQESQQIFAEVDCHENLSQQFKINLKDTSYITIESLLNITIVDELRNPKGILNLRSEAPTVTQNDLKHSFTNYPNPFGNPNRRQTRFIYYLSQDADIELKIYTLIGELVWTCSYSSNDPQGKKGLHQKDDIVWDGRNTRGYKVLNGVYIARMETSYGESSITKIAVIK